MINIIDHVAVPKHILLTNNECETMLDEYIIKRKNLPRILQTDPIARYYNAKPSQIFRIIRPSEVTGDTVSYRLVIRGQINET